MTYQIILYQLEEHTCWQPHIRYTPPRNAGVYRYEFREASAADKCLAALARGKTLTKAISIASRSGISVPVRGTVAADPTRYDTWAIVHMTYPYNKGAPDGYFCGAYERASEFWMTCVMVRDMTRLTVADMRSGCLFSMARLSRLG